MTFQQELQDKAKWYVDIDPSEQLEKVPPLFKITRPAKNNNNKLKEKPPKQKLNKKKQNLIGYLEKQKVKPCIKKSSSLQTVDSCQTSTTVGTDESTISTIEIAKTLKQQQHKERNDLDRNYQNKPKQSQKKRRLNKNKRPSQPKQQTSTRVSKSCKTTKRCASVAKQSTSKPIMSTEKRVSFGNVEIRKYSRCLGDNPAASPDGPSLSLDWAYKTCGRCPVKQYEIQRSAHRTSCFSSQEYLMPLAGAERENLIKMHIYCTNDDIDNNIRESDVVRRRRKRSLKMITYDKCFYFLEKWQRFYQKHIRRRCVK